MTHLFRAVLFLSKHVVSVSLFMMEFKSKFVGAPSDLLSFSKVRLNPIRPGGGAQRPGWPNSQLPIRNLLSYDAQTW